MATLQQLVEARIGTVSETVLLTDLLNQALVNLFSILPNDKATIFATEKTADSGDPLPFRGKYLGEATVAGRKASFVPFSQSKALEDENSIYMAHALFPSVYIHDGALRCFPAGELKAVIAEAPTVLNSTTDITNSPFGSEEIAVLYACSQILVARARALEVPAGITPGVVPTVPAAPDFTFTEVNAETISPATIAALPTPPVYDAVDDGTAGSAFPLSFLQGQVGNTTDQLDISKWFSVLAQLIENEEDPELANQGSQRIQLYISWIQSAIQEAGNKFSAESQEYNAEVQKRIDQARLDAQRFLAQAQLTTETNIQNKSQVTATEIAEYRSVLERFGSDLAAYQNDIQAKMAQFESSVSSFGSEFQRLYTLAMDYYQRYYDKLQIIAFDESTRNDRASYAAESD